MKHKSRKRNLIGNGGVHVDEEEEKVVEDERKRKEDKKEEKRKSIRE